MLVPSCFWVLSLSLKLLDSMLSFEAQDVAELSKHIAFGISI